MEILSEVSPSKVNNNENCIFNNGKDVQMIDKVDLLREDDSEMVLNETNVSDNRCNNSLDEANNIPSNDIYNGVITDKDIFNDKKKDKFINLENEQDISVFDDILRQGCKILNEDNNSLKEQNESIDKDDFFPVINKDNNTLEEELAFNKGILEENECDELPLLDEAGIHTDSALSEPLSPEKDANESDAEHSDQERQDYRSTRKDLSLPYFQLPKPDLDEFLFETEKNLEVPLKPHESKLSEQNSVSSKSKQKDVVTLKPPPNVKGNFFDPKKVFITFDLSSDSFRVDPSKNNTISESKPKISNGSLNKEYEKVLTSLDADENTPGVKRLALKEFLKKQIDQKKYEAFSQSKILNNMDEEMEELFEKDEDLLTDDDDEDVSEDYEEATISFEKNDKKSGDETAVTEEPEEFQLNDENSDEESDDDFIGMKKTKKKLLVLEEDSCDTNDFMNEKEKDCDLLDIDNSSSDLPDLPEIVKTKSNEHSDKLNLDDVKTDNRDLELPKNKGNFQTSVNNSIFSQISSSMPSFQPGGGFLNQDHKQEDSSDSIISTASQENISNTNEENDNLYLHLQPEQNLSRSVKTTVLENDSISESASLAPSEDSNNFGIKLDDLPVSQTVNDSDIFLTEELAEVCSGAFNREAPSFNNTPETNLKYTFGEKAADFFDDEAELSGEDDGIDEKDDSEDEGDNLGLYASDEENLPEAEVLREEIADLHMKRLMDDDEERIKEIQEQFLDDGELNNDGAGRSRRFAWLNNDVDIAPGGDNSDSDSDGDVIDDSLAVNQEKAKWRQENKEDENEDITAELNSSGHRRKSFLKVDIIGKPKFSHEEDSSRRLSCKRPRGSYLNLDNSSASQVLKKLKASEDNLGGSRTTKHFVFRNDISDVPAITKEVPLKSITVESPNCIGSSKRKSVFSRI